MRLDRRRQHLRAVRARLTLEEMERRLVLSAFTVTNTSDNTSAGSLRWAIGQANAAPGSTIDFQIASSGVQTIVLSAALPTLTVAVTIDGTSEPAYKGSPLIDLDGADAGSGVSGLVIDGGNSVVKGLAINELQRGRNRAR